MTLSKLIAENTAVELVVGKAYGDYYIINFDLNLSLKGHDHAGFYFYLSSFGYKIEFNIYDTRHWNYDARRWYLPGEEQYED